MKLAMLSLAGLSLLATQAAAQQAQQFDLVCSGTEISDKTGTQPFTNHISIDLSNNSWCYVIAGACKAVSSFKSVDAGSLNFMQNEYESGGVKFYDGMSVDRTSGRFLEVHRSDSDILAGSKTGREGVCKPAPFTARAATAF